MANTPVAFAGVCEPKKVDCERFLNFRPDRPGPPVFKVPATSDSAVVKMVHRKLNLYEVTFSVAMKTTERFGTHKSNNTTRKER